MNNMPGPSASNNAAHQQPENSTEEEYIRPVTRSVTRNRRQATQAGLMHNGQAQVRVLPLPVLQPNRRHRIFIARGGVLMHPPGRHGPPPVLGVAIGAPIYLNPRFPSRHRNNDINQPIYMPTNRRTLRNTQRDPNTPRGPPPQCTQIRVLSGSINQIMEWFDIVQEVPLFEVTGYFIGIGMVNPDGPPHPGNEEILLLRDRRNFGPILRVIQPYHLRRIMSRPIEIGQLLRCIGKVVALHKMLAVTISCVSRNEQDD